MLLLRQRRPRQGPGIPKVSLTDVLYRTPAISGERARRPARLERPRQAPDPSFRSRARLRRCRQRRPRRQPEVFVCDGSAEIGIYSNITVDSESTKQLLRSSHRAPSLPRALPSRDRERSTTGNQAPSDRLQGVQPNQDKALK